MDDTMKLIMDELKEIRKSQAATERETRKNRETLVHMGIENINAQNNQAAMEQGINRIRESLEVLQADITVLKEDITDIKDRVVKLEIIQENIVTPNFKLISEGISEINERLHKHDKIEAKVDEHDDRIWALEQVVKAK